MTRVQLWSVWLCGLLLSGVFVFLGVEREYWKPPPMRPSASGAESIFEHLKRETEIGISRDTFEWKVKNLYLALLAPALILSACTLATAFGAPRRRFA